MFRAHAGRTVAFRFAKPDKIKLRFLALYQYGNFEGHGFGRTVEGIFIRKSLYLISTGHYFIHRDSKIR